MLSKRDVVLYWIAVFHLFFVVQTLIFCHRSFLINIIIALATFAREYLHTYMCTTRMFVCRIPDCAKFECHMVQNFMLRTIE